MGMIGLLKVALQLETAAFEKGSRRAAAEVDAFGSRAEKAGHKIGTMGKAIGVGVAAFAGSAVVGQIRDLVSAGLEYASSLGETAQQLGVSTKALQEYRYAASQVGISNDVMDNALAKLTKTLGEAGAGAKKPAEAFAALGIDIRDARGHLIDAGAAIPLIADALAKIPDPAARAAVEVQLFGRAGQQLDTLLAGGAGQINNLRDAAQRLGIVLSDKQIQNADDTADKLSALKQVLEARIAGVVADNVDAILSLANAFATLIDKIGGAIDAFRRFKLNQGRIEAKANATAFGIQDFFTGGNAADKYRVREKQFERALSGRGFGSPLNLDPAKVGRLSTKLADPYSFGKSPLAGFDAGGITGGLDAIGGSTADLAERMEANRAAWREWGEEAEVVARSTKQSFLDSAEGITGALQNLAYSVQGGGGFLSILSGVIGLATQFGKAGIFGKTIQTNLNAPGRLGGGPVSRGQLYTVGERGRELFVPETNGTIIANNKLGGRGQGGGNSYSFRGNLMTPEFWQMIQRGDMVAAQAGGEIAMRRSAYAGSRRVG